ncbi:MAG TPA: hypothetical protein VJB15_09160 [Rhodothermia bacterium]|nr:hypothetical protein [Rhodothermia bacterium]
MIHVGTVYIHIDDDKWSIRTSATMGDLYPTLTIQDERGNPILTILAQDPTKLADELEIATAELRKQARVKAAVEKAKTMDFSVEAMGHPNDKPKRKDDEH